MVYLKHSSTSSPRKNQNWGWSENPLRPSSSERQNRGTTERDVAPQRDRGRPGSFPTRDIALHTDNPQLWGAQRPNHVPVVYSAMVQAPATYIIPGWTIHLDEGTEILFPQHMAHEVKARGQQTTRRNTTHRLWVPADAICDALMASVA